MKVALALLSLFVFEASATKTMSLSPYDVVVPSLNGDPSSADRVVGQMYHDVSGNSFKAINKDGAVKTLLTQGDVNGTWQTSGDNYFVGSSSAVGIGGAPDGTVPYLQVTTNTNVDAIFVRAGTTGTDGALVLKPASVSGGTDSAEIQGTNPERSQVNPLSINPQGGEIRIGKPGDLTLIKGDVRMSAFGAGTCTFDASGNVSSSSDERLKTDIKPFQKGLATLKNIEPIQYRWNAISGMETEHEYVGFSAQNVQRALPEGVGQSDKGYLSLQERAIVATLVNAVKELEAEVQRLKDAKK